MAGSPPLLRVIVLVTVAIVTAYVGGLDNLFGLFSTWLYD